MRVLWTVAKFVIAVALLVPVSIIVLSVSLGILGTLVGLAFFALRIAVFALVCYGLFRLGVALFGGRSKRQPAPEVRALPPVDPYYEAAKRELDRELGHAR